MEREDQELEEAIADEDSSDEEENTPVPTEWKNQKFSKLVVNEGHRTPWEYHENEVSQGAMYPTKESIIDAVNSGYYLFRGSLRL